MAFTTNFNLPGSAVVAWRKAYPGKTTYVALRDEAIKRGLNDDKIRAIAAKHGTTITEVCRKILTADHPELAAAWPKSVQTPGQLVAYQKRALDKDLRSDSPAIRQASAIIGALLENNDNGNTRMMARRWLRDYGGVRRPEHNVAKEIADAAKEVSGNPQPVSNTPGGGFVPTSIPALAALATPQTAQPDVEYDADGDPIPDDADFD